MEFETRNAAQDHDRARRVDSDVLRRFLGLNAEAPIAADEVAARRRAAAEQRLAEQLAALEQSLKNYWRPATRMLRLALTARGYHYSRGKWRFRRVSKANK